MLIEVEQCLLHEGNEVSGWMYYQMYRSMLGGLRSPRIQPSPSAHEHLSNVPVCRGKLDSQSQSFIEEGTLD